MSEDATFGSYSAPPRRRPVAPRAARPWRHRHRRRILAGASLIAGAAALVGLGAAAGASFADGHGRAAATYPTLPPRAGEPRPAADGAAHRDQLSCRRLEVALTASGDGDTVFVVHGSGLVPLDPGTGAPGRARGGARPAHRGPAGDLQLRDRPGPPVLHRADPAGPVPGAGHRRQADRPAPASRSARAVTAGRGRRSAGTARPAGYRSPPPGARLAGRGTRFRAPESTTGPPAASTRPGRSAGQVSGGDDRRAR